MKFSIERDPLLKALQDIQSVVEKKNTMAVLANILTCVSGRTLTLTGSDLIVGIRINLEVDGTQDGKITFSAKKFLDIVKELPNCKIEITKKTNNLIEIVAGKAKYTLMGLPAEDYPNLPDFESKQTLEIKSETLRTMLERTEFSVSTDATRYNLNGVFLEPLESEVLRMVGMDGHRLSFIDQPGISKEMNLNKGIIIPKKGVSELRKLLTDAKKTIHLLIEKPYIYAKSNQTQLFIKLIDGMYPDYKVAVPKDNTKSAKLEKEKFYSALKRVAPVVSEKSRAVRFQVQPGLLKISANNPELGEVHEELDVEYQGETIEIGFNIKYLLEYCEITQNKAIEILLKDRTTACIIRGTEEPHHTYIVMPMRM